MKKNNLIILSFLLVFASCNKIGTKDKPIPIEQIFGSYDLLNGEKITLHADYTYTHFAVKNDTSTKDKGVSFAVFGFIPLYLMHRLVKKLENYNSEK